MKDDILKFGNKDIFEKYKEEIKKDKEKYKPALLKALEEDKISNWIYEEIIDIWRKEWKEEVSIEIDKLKFGYWTFRYYKEEISKDKERYKPALLQLLEEDKINEDIYEEIVDIWEKKWKEEHNIKIDRLKIGRWTFKYYKEEIVNDKEKYKPVLLKALKEDSISKYIYEEIIELWEKEWKEEPNTEIDKLKFYDDYYDFKIFKKYKREIKKIKNKERYKPVLLGLLKKDRINSYIYEEIIEIWEKEWKEEANLEIDKLKFYCYSFKIYLFSQYRDEIKGNKERYKPVLLELLEEDKISEDIYKEIIEIWEDEWKEERNIKIDKLKFNKWPLRYYKEEIGKNKERYKPLFLEVLEKDKIDSYIYEDIIEIWEEEWKEEANLEIDKFKFCNEHLARLFEKYKEEISKDKERYKPVLLELLEEDRINKYLYKEILKIWEEEWKEEANIEIDKLKFYYDYYGVKIFNEYKEEISKDKERYKPVLLKALEEDKIDKDLYKEILKIWEKTWGEEAIIKLNKRTINIDELKFEDSEMFKYYKKEIIKDKERYKPVLLKALEEDSISKHLYKEILKIWEEYWKEEANIYIDKLKFKRGYIFKNFKEEISKDKERYKPVLLELLEEKKIDNDIYKEIIVIWEKDWKEEAIIKLNKRTINIDEFKFKDSEMFKFYKEEISKNKERYKPFFLEALEEDKISKYIYKEIIELWEKEWKEVPSIDIDKLKFRDYRVFKEYKKEIKGNRKRYKPLFLEVLEEKKIDNDIYKEIIELWEEEWKEVPSIDIDKLKFRWNLFEEYKEEISKEKERYKPVLLELLEENKIDNDIYKEIIDIWEKEWKEVPNIDIDKLKFYYYRYRSTIVDIFNKYKKEIINDKERYKPVLLELLEKKKIDDDIYEEIIEILEKDWKEEGEIEENFELINIDSKDYFVENRDEIIRDREKYEGTVRRSFVLNTYKEIKPILNSWGYSDIELLTKLLLKSTYETYNTLYSELKDKLIENRDRIIENISKNYKTELKDKTVKLFILTTIQTVDELENKLKLLKVKDMDKLVEYLIKLNFDKDIDSEVLENVIKIVIDKISEVEYIKLLLEKSKKSLSNSSIKELVYIFDKIDSKDSFDKFVKEFEFDSPINFLEYLKDKKVPLEFTKRYMKLLEEYYPAEFDKFKENLGERLIDDFKGTSYENCVEYSKYRDILDNMYNYEDLMKFRVVIENGRYLNKRKISEVDIKYNHKERIKIAYWGKSIDIRKLSKVDEYTNRILPKNKKYINYEIDDLGFNDKKERYFRYDGDNIVVKLKDRKLKIFSSSGKEIKRLSSTSEDFYTVRTIENIKELKKMVKNVYTDGDNGIKKEYCNDVLRDYDLWREIYIDNILLQEYATNLIWEEVDSDDNIVGRFRYSEENNEFCDSNDDEYNINKENRIRLLSLDKVSNDEVDRWREQLDDYEIVQPVPQLELYNIDYSDIDPKNVEISNNEIELGKLEKNDIGLELKFKDDEMYFEIKDMLKIQLEDKIKWTKYKTLPKDEILKISKIKLLKKSDYSLRMVKLLKDKLGI